MARQNKFARSVKERQEMEANNPPKAAALPLLELPEQKPEDIKLEPQALAKVPAAGETPIKEEPADIDLSGFLDEHPQRQAKNKTFYLDREVVDAIRKTAKANKTTESRLVNDILRKVLKLR